jgi:hypothetical protein
MRCLTAGLLLAFAVSMQAPAVRAERVRLESDAKGGRIQAAVMKPFDVYLVAERDSAAAKISSVAYTLDVPDGLVVVGEELLVESLIGLGTSRTGMNLVFRCVEQPRVRVTRFRFVANRPLQDAVLALRPEPKTNFLGLVSCRDENFDKFASPPDSLVVGAR